VDTRRRVDDGFGRIEPTVGDLGMGEAGGGGAGLRKATEGRFEVGGRGSPFRDQCSSKT
jgi:hypothetical protein